MERDAYQRTLRHLHIELLKLQRWVVESNQRLLLVFEGRDAAGKGGAIKRLTKHLNPRGCRIVALTAPTEQERSQWYFQRYFQHLPAAGEVVIFDRSWYNRAGLERVMGFCSPADVNRFMTDVPDVERMLVDNGIQLFKFYFEIDREEQARRIEQRRQDPLKKWKLTWLDEQAQLKWDEYTHAENEMFRGTSTVRSPWIRVDANNKRRARVEVIRFLLAQLDYPEKVQHLVSFDRNVITSETPQSVTAGDAAMTERGVGEP